MKMEKLKRELKLYDEIRIWLPPDMDPLTVIRDEGCDNDYFTLSEDARRVLCKYDYCPHGRVCRMAT